MNRSVLLAAVLTGILAGVFGYYYAKPEMKEQPPAGDIITSELITPEELSEMEEASYVGDYLSAHFAQAYQDWNAAYQFILKVKAKDKDSLDILKKTMVLAMGSGHYEEAVKSAERVHEQDENDFLSALFVTLSEVKNGDYDAVLASLETLPPGALAEFMAPLIQGWAYAAKGEDAIIPVNGSLIHNYHEILIYDYLDKKEKIPEVLERSLNTTGLTYQDIEDMGDVFAYIGDNETAKEIYGKIAPIWLENKDLKPKMERLEAGESVDDFLPVEDPANGIAKSLYDMARLLFREQSDDSARLFANMALYLDPDLVDAHMLLGYIAARLERYDDAIAYYKLVPAENENYDEAQRMAADLLEQKGDMEGSLEELRSLYDRTGDLDALIKIGDIHRRNEDYTKAIKAYNEVADTFEGDEIPHEYWQIHYIRGISYEQAGEWEKAEKDLEAALAYQPDNATILNYLGYSWADRSENLDKALDMIRKAVTQQPDDGYIVDSLGWVLYRMGKYDEAVIHLEHAVELLPYDPVINDHLGDAYWQVGRKHEARFQWERAKNHSDDEILIEKITSKIENGMDVKGALGEKSGTLHSLDDVQTYEDDQKSL